MNTSALAWFKLLRPGDGLVFLAGAGGCIWASAALWQGGAPQEAVVRLNGDVVAQLTLTHAQRLPVQGPLGTTLIEIAPGRARVAKDPGLHQYCVKQGWLTRAGAVAICAPNQISLTLTGSHVLYDALNY